MVRRRHDWYLHHYIHAQQLAGRPAMVLVFGMPHCRCAFPTLPDNTTERWKHEAEIELWWLAVVPFLSLLANMRPHLQRKLCHPVDHRSQH